MGPGRDFGVYAHGCFRFPFREASGCACLLFWGPGCGGGPRFWKPPHGTSGAGEKLISLKNLPGWLPVTPSRPSGFLPGLGVFYLLFRAGFRSLTSRAHNLMNSLYFFVYVFFVEPHIYIYIYIYTHKMYLNAYISLYIPINPLSPINYGSVDEKQ